MRQSEMVIWPWHLIKNGGEIELGSQLRPDRSQSCQVGLFHISCSFVFPSPDPDPMLSTVTIIYVQLPHNLKLLLELSNLSMSIEKAEESAQWPVLFRLVMA